MHRAVDLQFIVQNKLLDCGAKVFSGLEGSAVNAIGAILQREEEVAAGNGLRRFCHKAVQPVTFAVPHTCDLSIQYVGICALIGLVENASLDGL